MEGVIVFGWEVAEGWRGLAGSVLTFVYGNIHILTPTGCVGEGVVMVVVRWLDG